MALGEIVRTRAISLIFEGDFGRNIAHSMGYGNVESYGALCRVLLRIFYLHS